MGRSGRAFGALLLRGCSSPWAHAHPQATGHTASSVSGWLAITGHTAPSSSCPVISGHSGPCSASATRQASSSAAAQAQGSTDQASSRKAQGRAPSDSANQRPAPSPSSRTQGSGSWRPAAPSARTGPGQGGPSPPPSSSRPAAAPALKTHGSGRVSDLALENAPTKILQLIGDPRTGVADDVTSNPFGSTTVDLIHHQASNEVYWFKYEYAGEQLRDTHRDARLSEYSKNLMYLLRAKDPRKWSIDALAHRFRIRPQRVLAILALKEMESHAIEQHQSMQGPLSGYTCTINLDDVQLDGQGNPLNWDSQVALAALPDMIRGATDAGKQPESVLTSGRAGLSGPVPVNPGTLPLQNAIPRTRLVSAQVGLQLAQLLGRFQFDLESARSQILSEIQAAVTAVQAALPADALSEKSEGGGEEGEAGEQLPFSSGSVQAGVQLLRDLKSQEAAVSALFDTLDELLLSSEGASGAGAAGEVAGAAGEGAGAAGEGAGGGRRTWKSALLREECQIQASVAHIRQLLTHKPPDDVSTSTTTATTAAVTTTSATDAVTTGSSSTAASEALPAAAATADASSSASSSTLETAVSAMDDRLLMHVIARLAVQERVQLLAQVPSAAARLQVQGIDLPALKTQQQYTSTQGSTSKPTGPEAPLDVLGFQHISAGQYNELVDRVQAVQAAQAAVARSSQLVGGGSQQVGQGSDDGSSHVEWLRSLVRLNQGYQATSAAVGHLAGHTTTSAGGPVNKLALLKLLHEADPGVLERITMVEAAQQLEQAGDKATAAQVWAKVREAAGQAGASEVQPDPLKYMQGVGDPALGVKAQGGAWDALSAWLDAVPGGKVYHRGSGERQVARLPTFPAFEGQPLSSVDALEEGVLSALNRQLSARQQQDLDSTFRKDVLYNLGLVGQGLWDGSTPKPAANLNTQLDTAPIVLYDISHDGNTVYPPREVVEPDGTRRPLNDKERVWQERRQRMHTPNLSKVHYTMTRVKRKPELE